MIPYQHPWDVESIDGLPRLMGNGNRSEWWHRRLPAGKGISPEASLSLYKQSWSQSHPFGLSQSPSTTTTTMMTTTNSAAPGVQMQYHALPLSVVSPPVKVKMDCDPVPPANSNSNPTPNPRSNLNSNGDRPEDNNADPLYSKLIYEALLAALGKRLPLQGIYLWFEKNTVKGTIGGQRGGRIASNTIFHECSKTKTSSQKFCSMAGWMLTCYAGIRSRP